jgi:hypothetical protein
VSLTRRRRNKQSINAHFNCNQAQKPGLVSSYYLSKRKYNLFPNIISARDEDTRTSASAPSFYAPVLAFNFVTNKLSWSTHSIILFYGRGIKERKAKSREELISVERTPHG